MFDKNFYKNKTILVTGHTGFKGSWLTRVLQNLGSRVVGYSLTPLNEPNLFTIAKLENCITSVIGDIRDYDHLLYTFLKYQPELVIHLAAQPLVLDSYKAPKYTYETNVMGTVNLLECIRNTQSVKSVLNVTTDKVYKNKEWCWGYREYEQLDGFDPYSNSKSCSELVTHSYINSFFTNSDRKIAISTARAGNVIGGGDFSVNRIIPDCVRAAVSGKDLIIRNPNSIRPYQHVLEPILAYLMIIANQFDDINYQGSFNIGPYENDCISTKQLVELFKSTWFKLSGNNFNLIDASDDNAPHEANFLKLDCSKINHVYGWSPILRITDAIDLVCRFTKVFLDNENIVHEMDNEINSYMGKFFND